MELSTHQSFEKEQDWFFTWGYGQVFPNKFVRIYGTYMSARNKMAEAFGEKWSMQYEGTKKQEEDFKKHDMREIPFAWAVQEWLRLKNVLKVPHNF
jgi:hypothetical protein